jgi:inorganic pyrophosphatase
MLSLRDLGRHPAYPRQVWVVIEQPRGAPFRYQFDPDTDTFQQTGFKSLLYARGFSGAYGWIAGTGTPPGPHYDALLVTALDLRPGDVVPGHVCGLFVRADNDHKFVVLDEASRARLDQPDFSRLEAPAAAELRGLYPQVSAGEGWFGSALAYEYLLQRPPTHD